MYKRLVKRPLDFLLALAGLLLLSPLLLITAVLVRIKLGAPVIFSQTRPGKKDKNGSEKLFTLYKFRTMTDARAPDGSLFPDSERITRFGRLLRSTSIDELPELWNIVRGDMAIVGPRPLLVKYLPRYTETQRRRHEVRPGLTGYAQVHGRNTVSWDEKFRLDVAYVDNVTFIGDLKIILQTVKSVVARDGISSGTSATMEEFTGSKEG